MLGVVITVADGEAFTMVGVERLTRDSVVDVVTVVVARTVVVVLPPLASLSRFCWRARRCCFSCSSN